MFFKNTNNEDKIKVLPKRKTITSKSWGRIVSFTLIHIAGVLLPFFYPPSLNLIVLMLISFYVRMFCVTAGYHRYFSHRSYETSRVMQFLLALLGSMATQRGPLWWSAHHRHHHAHSDSGDDLHSPVQDGFWFSHLGWIFTDSSDITKWALIQDFSRFPELRLIDKFYWAPPFLFGLMLYILFDIEGVVWGYLLPTVLLWHVTYIINSLCHIWGYQRYKTEDSSRNNFLFALMTMGEGWHNNHHRYCASVNQGWFWYEIDVTYYILLAMKRLGLVWNFKYPPEKMRTNFSEENA